MIRYPLHPFGEDELVFQALAEARSKYRDRTYNCFKDEYTEVLEKLRAEIRPKGFLDSLRSLFNEERSIQYSVISQIIEERKEGSLESKV